MRVSPRKLDLVAATIRGKKAASAVNELTFSKKRIAQDVKKALNSAIANAEHHHEHPVDGDELYVSACYADEGPTLKRWRPRARGRATRIRKRTCHITVIVSRLPEDELRERRTRQPGAGDRRRRIAASRRGARKEAAPTEEIVDHEDVPDAEAAVDGQPAEEAVVDEEAAVEADAAPEAQPEAEADAAPEAAEDKEQDT